MSSVNFAIADWERMSASHPTQGNRFGSPEGSLREGLNGQPAMIVNPESFPAAWVFLGTDQAEMAL